MIACMTPPHTPDRPATQLSYAKQLHTVASAWNWTPLVIGIAVVALQIVLCFIFANYYPNQPAVWSRMTILFLAIAPWGAWLVSLVGLKLLTRNGADGPAWLKQVVRQRSSGVVAWWIGVGWFMVLQSITTGSFLEGYDAPLAARAGFSLIMTGVVAWIGNLIANGRLQVADDNHASELHRDLKAQLDRIEEAAVAGG